MSLSCSKMNKSYSGRGKKKVNERPLQHCLSVELSSRKQGLTKKDIDETIETKVLELLVVTAGKGK